MMTALHIFLPSKRMIAGVSLGGEAEIKDIGLLLANVPGK